MNWWKTKFGTPEVELLRKSVEKEWITQGKRTEEFESKIGEILGAPYVVATTSGSAALCMALLATGVCQSDEVIMPNRTWIATANAAILIGAIVVLVDVRKDLPIIDVSKIEDKITKRTKAIIPVHLNGRASEMEAIRKLANKYSLVVIEDACQSFYSACDNGYLGTISDVGCFSLGLTKLISTGQGGLAVTRDKNLYEKLVLLRNQGVHDCSTETYGTFGFNFKYNDLLASFGIAQLERLKPRVDHLKRVYLKYFEASKELSCLDIVPINLSSGEIPLYAEFLCPERDTLIEFLHLRGIQTRKVPPNLNTASTIGISDDFPNSIIFGQQGIYLPCGPDQPLVQVDEVIKNLYEFNNITQ